MSKFKSMFGFCVILLCAVVVSGELVYAGTQAQEGSAWNMFYPTSRTIYGIDSISATEVWFVGGDRYWEPFAFHYRDGVWTLERDGPDFPQDSIYAVDMLSATNGWAVGPDGVMYHYDGNIWSQESYVTSLPLYDIQFLSETDGWAVGGDYLYGDNHNVILHYDGVSWSIFQEDIGSASGFNAIDMVSLTDGWAVSDSGDVFHYGGTQWSSADRPTTKTLFGLDMITENNGWAVGYDGAIVHYDGNTWSSVSGGNGVDFTDIAMVSANDGWAIGYEGDGWEHPPSVIMHYDGTTWSRVSNPMPARVLHRIHMQSLTNGWIGGSSGTVLHYDGSSWSPDPRLTRPAIQLYDVDILSQTDVWAVGGSWTDFPEYLLEGNIIHFDGTSWTDFSVSADVYDTLNGVDMVSPTDGWIVGSDGAILRYNGSEWDQFTSPVSNALNDIYIVSPTDGWAVGNGGTILHFDGDSWATVSSPTTASLSKIEMLSPSVGWILGRIGGATVLLRYNGAAWVTNQLIEDVSLYSFDMLSDSKGWAVGNDGAIFQYDGDTWSEAFSPTGLDLDVVRFTPSGDGRSMGYSSYSGTPAVLHWNGVFWEFADRPTAEGHLFDIAFAQVDANVIGWAVGSDLWHLSISLPSITKSVTPQGQVNYGDELTYTLVISATPGTHVGFYDPLTGTTFTDFVEQPPGVAHSDGVVTGTLTVTPTNQITVSFVTQVSVPITKGVTVSVTNRACIYEISETLDNCIWSEEVTTPAFHPYSIYLPVALRNH